MLLRSLLLPAAVAATMLATPAAAWMAQNNYVVNNLGGGRFEVQPRGGLSDANAWCAAGDFAMRSLGARTGTRIWRISPPPRPRGQGITFSMSAEGAASSTGMATLGGSGGGSRTATSAQAGCAALRETSRNR